MNNINQIPVGYLKVKVTTAGGALPIEGAAVYIFNSDIDNDDTSVIMSLNTDESGLTRMVELPAKSIYEDDESTKKSYALYNIKVQKLGFVSTKVLNVPIFSGVTTIEPVSLIPESESAQMNPTYKGYETTYNVPEVRV